MTTEVWRELNKLKETHPDVNFFWLEHEINNAGEEVDLLNEELDLMWGETHSV